MTPEKQEFSDGGHGGHLGVLQPPRPRSAPAGWPAGAPSLCPLEAGRLRPVSHRGSSRALPGGVTELTPYISLLRSPPVMPAGAASRGRPGRRPSVSPHARSPGRQVSLARAPPRGLLGRVRLRPAPFPLPRPHGLSRLSLATLWEPFQVHRDISLKKRDRAPSSGVQDTKAPKTRRKVAQPAAGSQAGTRGPEPLRTTSFCSRFCSQEGSLREAPRTTEF